MNIANDLLPLPWLIAAYVVFGAGLLWAILHADLVGFIRVPRRQHLFFGASLIIMCLWLLRAGITPGLGVHLLGMTSLTLLLGWQLAIIGSVIALIGVAFLGYEEWITLGLIGMLLVMVPVMVTHGIWRFSNRYLPPNLFIYILGCGFFGAGLATLLARFAVSGVLLASSAMDWYTLRTEYLPIALLTQFPESFINGTVIAAIAAYRPEWLATLDAKRYLDEK